MRHKLLLFLFFLSFAGSVPFTLAQESTPCLAEAEDTNTELRVFGTGNGETAFEALNAAINNAMTKLKPRCAKLFPNRKFEYSIMAKSTADEDEIELDTTIGQPAIVCNEITEATLFTAYVVISFDIPSKEGSEDEE